jgi:hypothetical protein
MIFLKRKLTIKSWFAAKSANAEMKPTNILFNIGVINEAAFAGQTNEFFIGIVGGASTNAQLTVQNLEFSISAPSLMQAQTTGNYSGVA